MGKINSSVETLVDSMLGNIQRKDIKTEMENMGELANCG